ncbi:MAG: trigger factor [Caldicoprobacterales bacterium]|nr:trigger factor [Clostridiales bacterium]
MKTSVEKLENSKVKLEIEVDAQQFDEAMEKAYLKNRGSITIPGFRKGKAPRKIIERYYGEGIFYEDAINEACPKAYDEAVRESGIEPVEQPTIDIVQIGGGQNFIFTAEVTVKPEVELGQYKGIEINKVEYNVTDQDIDEQLEMVREQNARWISVEDRAAKEGDLLTIDYKGYVDGEAFEGGTAENQTLEIGSQRFIPGFEEQLIGVKVGEEKEIQVTFPEEYHAEDLKGKEATFEIKVHEIKEKELPELDDEFVKDISEFDTLEEYKDNLRKTMEENSKQREKVEMENQLLEKVVENAKVDIPEVMVENEIDAMVRDMDFRLRYQGMNLQTYLDMINTTMEDFRAQFKDDAYNRVKLQLTIDQIIKEEKIEATDEDLEREYTRIAEEYKLDLDRVKNDYQGREEGLKNSLAVQKAVDFLMEHAVVVEKQEETQEEQESE